MGLGLAGFGYTSMGMDDARTRQDAEARRVLERQGLEQAHTLTGQQITAGEAAATEEARLRAAAAAERAAVAGAPDLASAAGAASKARQGAGDLAGATTAAVGGDALKRQAFKQFAIDVHNGADPNDAAQALKRIGVGTDFPDGQLSVIVAPTDPAKLTEFQRAHPEAQPGDRYVAAPNPQTGNVALWNASRVAYAGQKTEVSGSGAPGGSFLVREPGKAPRLMTTPEKGLAPKEEIITVKNEDGSETALDARRTVDGRPNPNFMQPVVDGRGGAGGANVRKDLPVLKEITRGVTELGEEYGKTDMSNPLNPKITLTPKGQQVAMVAEQIRLANQSIGARTVIDMAVKGKPMWKIEDGKRTGVVLYNGQEFPMSTAVSKSSQPERHSPAAKPAPAEPKANADKPGMAPKPAAKPAAKPAESPTAKAARERRAAVQSEREAEIDQFNKTLTTPGIDRKKAATKKEELARDASKKERANVISKNVAERLGRFSKDDQIWFSDHAGDLTPRERKALHDRRARGGYAKGGKVSRMQCHGMG